MRWEAFCRALLTRYSPEPMPLDDPPTDHAELARAARELLENAVFRLAMERVQERLVASWQHSALGAKEEREAAYRLHAAIEELRAELVRMTTNK